MTSGSSDVDIKYYVYVINNDFNDRVYYGWTINPVERWGRHCAYGTSQPVRHRSYLYPAMRMHGADHFKLTVLDRFDEQWEAAYVEQVMIREAREDGRPLYNITDGGDGCSARRTPEFKAKLRAARLGKRWSDEKRKKFRDHLAQPEVKEHQRQNALVREAKKRTVIGLFAAKMLLEA